MDVDLITFGLVGLALASLAAVVLYARPPLAVVAYLGVIMFVPAWLAVSLGVSWSPAMLMGAVVLVTLTRPRQVQFTAFELILFLLIAVLGVAAGFGYVSSTIYVGVLSSWLLPFAVARTLYARVGGRWIYDVFAVLIMVVALLAVVEGLTSHNFFDQLAGPYGDGNHWANLQMRGGRVRVEGAFGHSIALGGALTLGVPLIWVSRLNPWVKIVGEAVVAAAAVLTFSRIGIICTLFATLLCLVLLREHVPRRQRLIYASAGVVGLLFAIPTVLAVFADAGGEAEGSANFRVYLLQLIPAMAVLGRASAQIVDQRSIDSAPIAIGVTLGMLPLIILLGCVVAAVIAVVRGRVNGPLLAVVALFPGLTAVAFITQFTSLFWFVVGLAVAELQAAAARVSEPEPGAITMLIPAIPPGARLPLPRGG